MSYSLSHTHSFSQTGSVEYPSILSHLKSPKRSYHLASVKHTALSHLSAFVCFLWQNIELLHRCLASFAFQPQGRNNKATPAITRFHTCTRAWWHTLSLSVLWRPRQEDLTSRKDPVQWYDPISKSMKRNNNNNNNKMYAPCPPSLIYVPFT